MDEDSAGGGNLAEQLSPLKKIDLFTEM